VWVALSIPETQEYPYCINKQLHKSYTVASATDGFPLYRKLEPTHCHLLAANMAQNAENGNPTWSGRIPSLKKSAVEAIKSLIPKKRSQKAIFDSDDESVRSVSASRIKKI
jgi:hypothetical protein